MAAEMRAPEALWVQTKRLVPSCLTGYVIDWTPVEGDAGMQRYTIPVGENGRIILPLELRRALGIEKGSRVVIEAQDDRLELTTAERLRRQAQERYRRLFPDRQRGVVDAFVAEKREEARREGD